MHLVYQPVFACAWVAEKSPSGIDTGPTMVEEALADLRERLPFVRGPGIAKSSGAGSAVHSNFALAIADLHHNAGNLYLMKGYHRRGDGSEFGYLRRAQYHYACAIHEARRHCTHRMQAAQSKWGSPQELTGDSTQNDAWPQFILRRLTSALFGLANCCLARVRLAELQASPTSLSKLTVDEDQHQGFRTWIDGATESHAHDWIENWIGTWNLSHVPHRPRGRTATGLTPVEEVRLVNFRAPEGTEAAFHLRGHFVLSALATRLLERGGFVEEAAREHLQIAYTVENVLWDLQIMAKVNPRGGTSQRTGASDAHELAPSCAHKHAQVLMSTAVLALQAASENFRLAFSANGRGGDDLIRQRQPVHLQSVACSLGLLASQLGQTATAGDFGNLVLNASQSSGAGEMPRSFDSAWFRLKLAEILAANAYSMLTRLSALRVLAIDTLTALDDDSKAENSANPAAAEIDELNSLNEAYASAPHFTPAMHGAVLALRALRTHDQGHVRTALHTLHRSLQTYTSQAAYYELISKLYYLDDDFNDRELQTRHAWQMMSGDLTRLLIERLEAELRAQAATRAGGTKNMSNSATARQATVPATAGQAG
jgi:hypothetical protein